MQVSGLGCVGEMVFECCYDVARMLLGCCWNGLLGEVKGQVARVGP